MSSAPSHRSQPQRGPAPRNQKRFVPKADASAATLSRPSPPLTTALRASSAASASSRSAPKEDRIGSGGGENFVTYLPQDEAVASGLGAEAGGLDAVESQSVVDLLNDELSKLLRIKPRDFWSDVSRNTSLHEFVDSYLQFRHRWYDLPHHGPGGIVAGVVVGELELCRRVFMLLYRISSNKDPGAPPSDSLSSREHTALLQEKKLLDLPKLLDICAIYGHDNGELTSSLVRNAIKSQPELLDNISSAVSHFLNITRTMYDRCMSSLEVLNSSVGRNDHGQGHLHKDFLEVMDFINDAVVTLDAFVDAYKPSALLFALSFELSYGIEELLNTLARLHDSLLPSLLQGFKLTSSGAQKLFDGMLPDIVHSVQILSKRTVRLGWRLLDFCYLDDQLTEDDLQATTKMFPVKVDDPVIRGDILVQTLTDVHGEATYVFCENLNVNSRTYLQSIEEDFEILNRISGLRSKGWLFMDEQQYQYLSQLAASVMVDSRDKEHRIPISSSSTQKAEETVILESKISQIKDLFPDYGKGFLSACLDVYNQDPEEVIQRILDGTLHEDLLALDTSREQPISPRKPAPTSRNDKGKGVLMEPELQNTALPSKVDLPIQGPGANGPSSSSITSSYGRYTRKGNDEVPDSAVLDSRADKDVVRSAVLAAEYEYEDEYDDSFDDLGLSVVESGYEETENTNDTQSSFQENPSSRWSSLKKPQFYVKDGKNYSYKVSGSVGVSSAREAAVFNQAQKDIIHGLGRGGNLPVGAVKKLIDAEEQDNEAPEVTEGFGRGSPNPRGRGGRRGGRNHYRKDRAAKKHFAGLGGN